MRIGRMRKKFFWTAGVLALLVLFGGAIFAIIKNKSASAADGVNYIANIISSENEDFAYDDWDRVSGSFALDTDGDGSVDSTAYCAKHDGADPYNYAANGRVGSGVGPITITNADNETDNGLIFKILYYGEKSEYFNPTGGVPRGLAIHYALDTIYSKVSHTSGWAPYNNANSLIAEARKLPIPAGENTLTIFDYTAKNLKKNDDYQHIITYSHKEIETFELTATKVWNDSYGTTTPQGAYDARPASITFKIHGSDGTSASIDLPKPTGNADNWGSVSFTGLKKGVTYNITEEFPDGAVYSAISYDNCSNLAFDSANKTCTITNKLKSVSFTKNWIDEDAKDRPVAYFCLVNVDGQATAVQYSKGCFKYDQNATDGEVLNGEWWGLEVDKTYKVCELSASAYDSKVNTCDVSEGTIHSIIDGYGTSYKELEIAGRTDDITKAYEIDNTKNTTELHVIKNWNDEDSSTRPAYIYVCVTSVMNNVEYVFEQNCVSIAKDDEQSYDFTKLPDDGTVYSACEVSENDYENIMAGEDNVECNKSANPVDGYTTSYVDLPNERTVTINNTKTEEVFVNVTKVWQDNGHEDLRPNKVNVRIDGYVEGESDPIATYNVEITPATDQDKTKSSTWTKTFGPYEKKYNDKDIEYRITETIEGDTSYDVKYDKSVGDHVVNFTIYNANRYLKLTKTWKDGNMYMYRPNELSFNVERKKNTGSWSLYQNYTVSLNPSDTSAGVNVISMTSGEWEVEIGPLPYYDQDGEAWTYQIQEIIADGYNAVDTIATGDMNSGFYLNNEAKFVEVFKVWDDQSNVDGKRPEYVDVEIVAKVNGVEVPAYSHGASYNSDCTDKADEEVSCRISSEDAYGANGNMWRKTYGPFWKYNAAGEEITYEAREILPDGSVYTASEPEVSGDIHYKRSYRFTNTYEAKTKIKVVKHWGIGDGLPASLPEVIYVSLYRNGVLDSSHSNIALTVSDEVADATPAGTSQEDMWYYAHVWSKDIENLDKYDQYGHLINWSVAENAVSGYTGNVQCDTGAGDYSRICNITNIRDDNIKLYVYKEWLDEDDNPLADDIPRPSKVRFAVLRWTTETPAVSAGTVEVTKDSNGTWWGELEDLPRYDSIGREYTYDIHEIPAGPFDSTISPFENDNIRNGRDIEGNFYFSASNKLTDNTSIIVEKCWVDNDNKYGTRPDSLDFDYIIKLDGVTQSTQTVTLTANDLNRSTGCWTKSFNGLPVHDATGKTYSYSFVEKSEAIEQETEDGHYESDDEKTCVAEDEGYVCTYTNRLVGTTSKTGTKTWVDGGKTEIRPDTLELVIYQRVTGYPEYVYEATPTWVKNNNNTWTYTYDNLPLYNEEGIKYSYRVEEKYTQNAAKNGDTYVSQATAQAGDFKNKITGKLNYCGKKIWVDYDAPEGIRPEDITVGLTRSDGEYYTTKVSNTTPAGYAMLCDDEIDETGDVWYFIFENLDKYDDEGNEYEYILSENAEHLDQYITTIADSEITNTYAPNKTSVTVEKVWLNDKKDDRPGYIEVTLYRDGKEYDKIQLSENAEHKWIYTWEDLDDNYEWTISEDVEIPNYYPGTYEYTSKVDGTYIKIYNQKIEDTPDTGDKKISIYAIFTVAVVAGGMFAARLVTRRR